ncbi:FxSxx-COOH system tetratricopeptide repeat protein [Micromonospora gifhornensis]|uniref:FxSxx-COOH system tetratricopeptide repeat protein n=1 Tax=Micromonospora gifhornensis TaxID=84594 RepID=UPI0034541F8C
MGSDFFISYTGVDAAWAEWVAVELEAAGYSTVLQAWDFTPGTDFLHKMQEATTSARRTVAVLSPDYFSSAFGEAEWRAAFAKDPSGELGLLVPVRVRDCQPPGLLATRVWVDLVDAHEAQARERLLTGVNRNRPRPTSAVFPGKPSPPAALPARSPRPFPGRPDAASMVVSNLLPANPGFVGREIQLTEIQEGLQRRGRVALCSSDRMAGIGKTQLALEFAHRHGDAYEVVWLVGAEQADLIGGQLAQAATRAGLVASDVTTPAAVQAMHTALEEGRRWLLIFDNVDDRQQVVGWLPPRGGHVIITSRNPGWHEDAVPVEVGLFGQNESADLLRRRIPALSESDASRLAEALGHLPLALAQAASIIAETGMSAREYLDLLDKHSAVILDQGRPSTYRVSLAAAVNLAADRLDQHEPAAAQLLTLRATMAPEPVPLTVFTQSLNSLAPPLCDLDMVGFYRVVSTLTAHGMAGASADGLHMHRLTQAVVRHRAHGTFDEARASASGLLAMAAPTDTDDPAFWPQWAALAPHLMAADPATSPHSPLREAACGLVLYLLRRAELHTAHTVVRNLYQSWQRLLGPDHPHTLKAATEYAHARFTLGAIREAHDIVTDTLSRYRRTLGDDHPDALRSAHDLAVTLHALGDYTQAHALDEDTLTRYRRTLGDDHPDTLSAAHGLAGTLHSLGDYTQAHALAEDTLTRYRRTLGNDHPDTLSAAHGLADTLHALGDHTQAHALAEDTLTRSRRTLGDDHPNTLSATQSLAATLHALGDYTQAHALEEDTLTRYRRTLGNDHPNTLSAAHGLAATLHSLGDYTQAHALAEDTLTRYRRTLGNDHPNTLSAAHGLAATLHALGDHTQAHALVLQRHLASALGVSWA